MKKILQAPLIKLVLFLVALLVTSACSNAHASSGVQVELSSQDDQLAFTQTMLNANAGESVTVVFKNSSKALQHNWVLVNGDDTVAKQVSEATLVSGPEQLLRADQANIVAHTNLLQSGEIAKLTFTAPTAPGQYTYLCTFPGHYQLGMKGTLRVEE